MSCQLVGELAPQDVSAVSGLLGRAPTTAGPGNDVMASHHHISHLPSAPGRVVEPNAVGLGYGGAALLSDNDSSTSDTSPYTDDDKARSVSPCPTDYEDVENTHDGERDRESIPEGSGAALRYTCITQQLGDDDALRLRVGDPRRFMYIPRWKTGETVTYVVVKETFPTDDNDTTFNYTVEKLAEAISGWGNVGVIMKRVSHDAEATFKVVFSHERIYPEKDENLPENQRAIVLAVAFFPSEKNPENRVVTVYGAAFEGGRKEFLANTLSHETGHVLGLRHEFMDKGGRPSLLWGKQNPCSVMNYFEDLAKMRIGKQDLDELRSFYEYEEEKYNGWQVERIMPPVFFYRGAPTKTINRKVWYLILALGYCAISAYMS